jgi:hypothetical protein
MAKVELIKTHTLKYNTQLGGLKLPEYGRNVQFLIEEVKKEPNVRVRQAMMEEVVVMMYQINPQGKAIEDYIEKLWKHAFFIAGYDLEGVVPPIGEIPQPEDAIKRPEKIPYPAKETRFRHYGINVQRMIKKALEMEEGAVKRGFVATIGSYMKLAYKTWNKEHYVSDDIIKADLEALSKGALTLDESPIENLSPATNSKSRSYSNSGMKSNSGSGMKSRSNNGGSSSNSRGGSSNSRSNSNNKPTNGPTNNRRRK